LHSPYVSECFQVANNYRLARSSRRFLRSTL
jgi:hypothetical protein